MKLDAQVLRYMSKDEFRVLLAIELGQRNHALVPTPLISRIASLTPSLTLRLIRQLHKHKLIYHSAKHYDGYRITYSGFDYLALHALSSRHHIARLGQRIGVGKEADVYICCNEQGEHLVLKLHRLGRISFRRVKEKRDYTRDRRTGSWLFLSRLAAEREWAHLQALHAADFPVPRPVDHNRHAVLMQHVDAPPLGRLRSLQYPSAVYDQLMQLALRLARHGLIHCDLNEYNVLLSADTEIITVIDFPQMVSTRHVNAAAYFQRDVQCVRRWFEKQLGYEGGEAPQWGSDVTLPGDEQGQAAVPDLGLSTRASGSGADDEERREFEKMMEVYNERERTDQETQQQDEEEGEEEDEEDEDEDEEGEEVAAPDDEETAEAQHELEAELEVVVQESKQQDEVEAERLQDSALDEDEDEAEDEDHSEADDAAAVEAAVFRARMVRKEARQQAERLRQQRRQERSQAAATAATEPQQQPQVAAEQQQQQEKEEDVHAVEEHPHSSSSSRGGRDGQSDALLLAQIKSQLRRKQNSGIASSQPSSHIGKGRNVSKDRKMHRLKADMRSQLP